MKNPESPTAEDRQAIEDIDYEVARGELDCADNYRWYKDGDAEGQKLYEEAREDGCCGSLDTSTFINGQKWFIGCNYGH